MLFANPLLLAGLALAGVPIIIHLLNRRRFVAIDWAPMHHLQMTLKTNRRRMRLEQLLLLLIRTLLVVLLILAVSRPIAGAAAGWFAGRGRIAQIIILDDSLSMGYEVSGTTAFGAARRALDALLEEVRPHDELTILTTSRATQPLVRQVHLTERGDLDAALAGLDVADDLSHWPSVLEAADAHLQSTDLKDRHVLLITDLRRAGWTGAVSTIAARWAEADVSCTIVNVAASDHDNVALGPIRRESAVALVSAPQRLSLAVRNDRPAPLEGATATLIVDGEKRSIALPDLAPQRHGTLHLTHTFRKAGEHIIRVVLPDDALAADNVQHAVVRVRSRLDIVLVDGAPSPMPFEGATDFLELAFTAGGQPWHVRHVPFNEWAPAQSAGADLTVLANVSEPGESAAAALEKHVERGMGLMIFMGDQVDPARYAAQLYRDAAGLLPARPESLHDEAIEGWQVEPLTGSPLQRLADLTSEPLSRIGAHRHMKIALPPETAAAERGAAPPGPTEADAARDRTRVLARWNHEAAMPAVVERRFGRGRVLLWTITADRKWSSWPLAPTFVLAMRETAMHVARRSADAEGIRAGGAMRVALPEAHAPVDAGVVTPDDEEAPRAARVEADELERPVIAFDQTRRAGIYEIRWNDAASGGAPHTRQVAVRPAFAESELDPVAEDVLRGWLAPIEPAIVRYGEDRADAQGAGRELWRHLAWLVLAMVMIETAFAVWVGRHR